MSNNMQYLLIDAVGYAEVLDERPWSLQDHQRVLLINPLSACDKRKLLFWVHRYLKEQDGKRINLQSIKYIVKNICGRGK